MEFLVRIETRLPHDLPDHLRSELLREERRRGEELLEAGVLRRIWRIPGRFANWSLYDVPDADRLHEALVSLPLSPWQHSEIHPLASHPLTGHPLAGERMTDAAASDWPTGPVHGGC